MSEIRWLYKFNLFATPLFLSVIFLHDVEFAIDNLDVLLTVGIVSLVVAPLFPLVFLGMGYLLNKSNGNVDEIHREGKSSFWELK